MDADLRAELRREVDDVWAEGLRLLPLDGGREDLTREKALFMGVLRTGDRTIEQPRFDGTSSPRNGITADGGWMRIDRMEFPNLSIHAGDKVVALERTASPMFEVISVDRRSHLRMIVQLGDA